LINNFFIPQEVASSMTTANVVEEEDNSTAVLSFNSPSGSATVFPENLYNKIFTYQAKNDRTANFTIPGRFSTDEDGEFGSGIFHRHPAGQQVER
jgi:hypothetical protein